MSSARKITLLGSGYAVRDAGTDTDATTGLPALKFDIDGNFPAIAAEAWFDAGPGIRIARLLRDRISKSNLGAGNPSSSFAFYAYFGDEDTTLGELSSDLHTAGEASETAKEMFPSIARRFAGFLWEYGAANDDAYTYSSLVRNIRVIADHGLALQGSWPQVGYTAKQMLGYAIPKHTGLEADAEDLEDTDYLIQQAWYQTPTTMRAIVEDLTKYDLLDWWVDGQKRFHLKRPENYGREWLAYVGPSGLSDSGLDSSRLWRSVVVSFRGGDGKTYTVGPLGSGADFYWGGLEVTDPDHPAVRAGITRRYLLSLNSVMLYPEAIEVGERFLREVNELAGSGSATLSGYAMDSKGILRPVSQLRAGDRVRFTDAADTTPNRVVRRTYDHDRRTVTVDLDAPSEAIPALIARIESDVAALQLAQ